MWLKNPQGRIVNLPSSLGQYYAGLDGWEVTNPVVSEKSVDYPVHLGGGFYKLSNGERVRGKQNAIDLEAEL